MVTQHFLRAALVYAATGKLTDARTIPVVSQVLRMSKPLHYGDYGGLPLKLIWVALPLATICFFGSPSCFGFASRMVRSSAGSRKSKAARLQGLRHEKAKQALAVHPQSSGNNDFSRIDDHSACSISECIKSLNVLTRVGLWTGNVIEEIVPIDIIDKFAGPIAVLRFPS